ncbi:hypothetical protein EDB19DRAFT_1633967, partial [Suillus lakei]
STPSLGIPKVTLARLKIDGEDRRPQFSIVLVCSEHEIFDAAVPLRLGPRPGTFPLDFLITRFNHVHVSLSVGYVKYT